MRVLRGFARGFLALLLLVIVLDIASRSWVALIGDVVIFVVVLALAWVIRWRRELLERRRLPED